MVEKCKKFEEIRDASALALRKVENHACLLLMFDSCWIMLSVFTGTYFEFAKNITLDYYMGETNFDLNFFDGKPCNF